MSNRIDIARRRNIPTYQDAFDELVLAFDIRGTGKELAWAKMAIRSALRRIVMERNWSCFLRNGTVSTLAAQTTGTVAIATTGVVTLSGATWPADMINRRLIVDSVIYFVSEVLTSTTLVVTEPPTTAVASGAAYQAVMAEYAVPSNARRMTNLSATNGVGDVAYVSPESVLMDRAWSVSAGEPTAYTVRADSKRVGRMAFEFSPMPTSEQRFDYLFYVATGDESPALYKGRYTYDLGKATWTNNSTTITAVGTTWSADMVGSVIRFGESSTPPTGEFGQGTSLDPFVAQRFVTAVAGDGTTLTVDEAMSPAGTGLGYTICDPLDMPGELWSAFMRLAEWEFAKFTKGGPDLDQRERSYIQELKRAFAADQSWTPDVWGSYLWIALSENTVAV